MMNEPKKIIGYTAGCFDMFHVGHLNILEQAKKYCDYLVVGVNSDEAMYGYKNKYPIIPGEERKSIVAAIKYVDEVVDVDNTDKIYAYNKLKFDIIFVGDDHKNDRKWIKLERDLSSFGVQVKYFKYTKHISSSILRKKIKS